MLFRALYTLFGAAATVTASPVASGHANHTIGPENGHLVIVGGNLQSDNIWQKIIELAGGPNSSIVVIPTAGGEPSYNESFASAVTLRELGANNVTVLHTYDPAVADTDEFVASLLEADGIYFGGGRQWRLVDAYAGTKAERAFQSVLDRGGVISGSSAGASIQASFLARGDTANNQVMIGDHTVGFGYLKNAAVDQHVLVRNRHFDMFDILKVHPELLGISIDEDTALVVHKNEAEVLGSTYALIYDGKFYSSEGTELKTLPPTEARFYFLKSGDRYDLEAREVIVDEDDSTASDQDRSEL
ncbi:unnamed protein product [Cercospora beticola]|nr:unnamed protein product [Cercospora beticola]